MTIDELKKCPNFTYINNTLALKFDEIDNTVSIHTKNIKSNETKTFKCKKLLLAGGVLGTSRIVIRSSNVPNQQLPFITNPYCYIPCLQLNMLGTMPEKYKSSMSQLVLYIDQNGNNSDVSIAPLFSYRSLLLYKLIKETPLNFKDGRVIMQYLQSALTIAGVHHPENGSSKKFIQLKKDEQTFTGDILTGKYELSSEEILLNTKREITIKYALKKLS